MNPDLVKELFNIIAVTGSLVCVTLIFLFFVLVLLGLISEFVKDFFDVDVKEIVRSFFND